MLPNDFRHGDRTAMRGLDKVPEIAMYRRVVEEPKEFLPPSHLSFDIGIGKVTDYSSLRES
jgi:hypothetical protein